MAHTIIILGGGTNVFETLIMAREGLANSNRHRSNGEWWPGGGGSTDLYQTPSTF